MRKSIGFFVTLALFIGLIGCAALLPSTKTIVQSPWKTFENCKEAFDKIVPHQTTAQELKKHGLIDKNSCILNYLEVQQRFMFNPSITKTDLDPEIQKAIEAKERCYAYEISPQSIQQKRNGNFFIDTLRFKRESRESGWQFKAIIVLVDNVVIYKLWGGTPNIDKTSVEKKPLGPLQEFGDIIIGIGRGLF